MLALCAVLLAQLWTASASERANAGAPARDILLETVMVPMRDGVRLATDVYRLKGAPPMPVLLCRTPYGKERPWMDSVERFVRAGYVVVSQDVRGRYASEGTFNPHANETLDGVDTLAWAACQPWSNGRIGTFGGSYLGGTQWLPARLGPPALKAMVPEVTFSSMHEGCAYQGGAKVLHDLRWVVADIIPDAVRRAALRGKALPTGTTLPSVDTAFDELPLATHPLIGTYAPFYQDWLRHPEAGEFWQDISPDAGYGGVTVPALNISGWYDIFIWGTLQNFQNMQLQGGSELARKNQKLIIGPWTHMNLTGVFAERNFGPDSSSKAMDLSGIKLRWYDRWLKGEQNGIDEEDPVLLFVMGIDRWRSEKAWPLPDTQYRRYYLHSAGRANSLGGDGSLSLAAPGQEPRDSYVADPMNPVPTLGGQVILPGKDSMGPRDQREAEARRDVLVYTTPVLDRAVEVTGPVELRLFAASSAPDTDITAKLVDVYPDGRAMILTDGILRARYRTSLAHPSLLRPGTVYELGINMLATSNVFLPGHRIRLEIASSNFPRFNRNSHTGGAIFSEPACAHVAATNRIYHDAAHASHLVLPIIER